VGASRSRPHPLDASRRKATLKGTESSGLGLEWTAGENPILAAAIVAADAEGVVPQCYAVDRPLASCLRREVRVDAPRANQWEHNSVSDRVLPVSEDNSLSLVTRSPRC
jgi:hypothetical protein